MGVLLCQSCAPLLDARTHKSPHGRSLAPSHFLGPPKRGSMTEAPIWQGVLTATKRENQSEINEVYVSV